ncbi:MAG: glycosyltransferase [Candidatus Methanomethylicaceae archaeon]
MVEVSIIIPTYNEEKNIARTLYYILNQTIPREKYEIIIVDGGSKDKTIEVASKYADKIIFQKSKGVGGARNDGAAIANGRILIHTDADVIVEKNWIEKILNKFSNGVIAVCGPDEPLENDVKLKILYNIINIISYIAAKLGIIWTRGTNTAVLKKAFLLIGGYKDYPICDDGELGIRLKKIGKIIYANDIKVKASARRFKKHGILKVLIEWARGDILVLIGRRPVGKYHKEKYF